MVKTCDELDHDFVILIVDIKINFQSFNIFLIKVDVLINIILLIKVSELSGKIFLLYLVHVIWTERRRSRLNILNV